MLCVLNGGILPIVAVDLRLIGYRVQRTGGLYGRRSSIFLRRRCLVIMRNQIILCGCAIFGNGANLLI
ncbi:hypothetical protein [Escherichia coli]|uniref:hypothetical protein n=1 Tax=Escherichia coli TaxID=562 RepID=UPI0012FFED1D|nr:hypothetical protein [Escherichia coli]